MLKKRKESTISLRIDTESFQRLTEIAIKENKSVSQIIRAIIVRKVIEDSVNDKSKVPRRFCKQKRQRNQK